MKWVALLLRVSIWLHIYNPLQMMASLTGVRQNFKVVLISCVSFLEKFLFRSKFNFNCVVSLMFRLSSCLQILDINPLSSEQLLKKFSPFFQLSHSLGFEIVFFFDFLEIIFYSFCKEFSFLYSPNPGLLLLQCFWTAILFINQHLMSDSILLLVF